MSLTEFAYSNGMIVTKSLSREEQKAHGQFMTPPTVARFMAQRSIPGESVGAIRVLDPAAGSGVLAAAVVEKLLASALPPERIDVLFYELDRRFVASLRALAIRMRRAASHRTVKLSVTIRSLDFLLSPLAKSGRPIADIVIANPPYFKLNASDARAAAHPYAVHGQPNIYALFMAASAGLVVRGGRWCFITPRSWTNGVYFAAMRRHLFQCLDIDAMHLFESRRDHFKDDTVLQEAMITWATAQTQAPSEVTVSSSAGSGDLDRSELRRVPMDRVVGSDEAVTIAVPPLAPSAVERYCQCELATHGLKVSTGPVVAFRSENYLSDRHSRGMIPLLWMQHVEHMRVRWPIRKKREHLLSCGATAWMLVPNQNLVVMRRFSPKEDPRRITAAPYLASTLPGEFLGLENHTNYILRPGGDMSGEEVLGLAAFLNSQMVDDHLRTIAGNTQVNATDLRKLPIPTVRELTAIGCAVRIGSPLAEVDDAVALVLGIRKLAAATA